MRIARLAPSALLFLSIAARAQSDPRLGLKGGWNDAGQAAWNLDLVAHRNRPPGFFNPASTGDGSVSNSDLAFSGNYAFQGNFNGFQIWDISDPRNPKLRTAFVCPGGQGDLSVYRNLLFMSAQETRGRVNCGPPGDTSSAVVDPNRFRGVRIFDITDLDHPRQVATVQTCRGSHTHTLVTDPRDSSNVYIYVSGTSAVRPAAELAGCSALTPDKDTTTSLFSIDVIQVPVAHSQNAKVVNSPRLFGDSTGAIATLSKGDSLDLTHIHSATSRCHDITVYPALSLAAGACAGNGILIDVSDPVHPKRVGEVSDPAFSFWHSATFSNDGRKVIFTDEWGGGTQPRCRATDRKEWGADAIFTMAGTTMRPASYYKLPVAQTDLENCVAHNGSIIPVPGRDIMAQAWYQGGVSVFDFTDPAHPKEIAFFDRGPMDTTLVLSGYWSVYWYNGYLYGSEIGRGLDVFDLKPSEFLSKNEIAAAKLVKFGYFNAQNQPKITWPPSFVVARAYLDQLMRELGISRARFTSISNALDRDEKLTRAKRKSALLSLAAELARDARTATDPVRVKELTTVVQELANR